MATINDKQQMKPKVYLVGAGKMGTAIAYDLLKFGDIASITFLDQFYANVNSVLTHLKPHNQEKNIPLHSVPIWQGQDFFSVLRNLTSNDIIISAADYSINEILTRNAINCGCAYVDLGGNNDVVKRQFEMHDEAVKHGARIIPDCGLAPGMAGLIAAHGIKQFDEHPLDVRIYVGGLPLAPTTPLKYSLGFSVKGLINEYIEPCTIIRDSKIIAIDSLTEIESIKICDIWLEAAHTSGGLSTLSDTFKDVCKSLEYKTLRYIGHFELINMFKNLGFLTRHRSIFERELKKYLPHNEYDMIALSIQISNLNKKIIYTMLDIYDTKLNHSAMARTTGYSASIVAQMLLDKTISQTGVLRGEQVVPTDKLIKELERRNIKIIIESLYNV